MSSFVVALSIIASSIILSTGTILAQVSTQDTFSHEILVNGQDITSGGRVALDPSQDLRVQVRIYDVVTPIILERISINVGFLGREVLSVDHMVRDANLSPGNNLESDFIISPNDYLGKWGVPLITGIYEINTRLHYSSGGRFEQTIHPFELSITGNPVATPLGAVALATGAAGLFTAFGLARVVVAPVLAVGSTAPMAAQALPLSLLQEFAANRLEPLARGRVTASVTKAAQKRVFATKCPICHTRIQHGHCATCKKPSVEVKREFTKRLETLVLQTFPILAQGGTITVNTLSNQLGISQELATDVLAITRSAKLTKLKGLAVKVMGRALMVGINFGLSGLLWITIGGFTRLTPTLLIVIIGASLLLPIIFGKFLFRRTGTALNKGRTV